MGGWPRLTRDQQSRENAVCKTLAGLGQALGGEIAYAPGLEVPLERVVISVTIGDSRARVIIGREHAQQLARSYYDLANDYDIPDELVGAAFETAAESLVSQLEGVFGTAFTVESITGGDGAEANGALAFHGDGGTLDGLTFFVAADPAAAALQTPLVPSHPRHAWVMGYPVRLASLGLTTDAFGSLTEMDILMPPAMTAADDGFLAGMWINNYTVITGVVRGNVFIIEGMSRGQTMAADDEVVEEESDDEEALADDDLDADDADDDAPEPDEDADGDDGADEDHDDEDADDDEGPDGDDEPEEPDDADSPAAAAFLTGAGIDTLPVRVDFEIGRLELSFAELGALAAGQSFDLGHPADDAVVLRVSGRKVGTGELIEIDGRVGVRIKSLIK